MYIIGDQKFKTQKDAKVFINTLLTQNGYGRANSTTHLFLLELIKRHPDYENKVGVGIDYFTIGKNPFSRNNCFYLTFTRIDGTTDDFSFNLCIKGKAVTLKQQTIYGMRNAVHDDIKKYKMNAEQKCNTCGAKDVDFDCDHYGTEFKQISETFIQTKGVCNSFTNDACFTCIDDDEYKTSWINYHNENAKLQLLCVKCHKEKKGKPSL